MTYTTEKNKQVYNDIKEGKQKTKAREQSDSYKIAWMEGFSRGYEVAIKNNKINA